VSKAADDCGLTVARVLDGLIEDWSVMSWWGLKALG